MNKKIGIIGAGVMGNILATRLAEENVLIHDCDKNKLSQVKSAVRLVSDQKELVNKSDILILAVKPQDFKELANQLKGLISKEKIVISIMAGVTIKTIQTLLGTNSVVRAMPNMPSKIGRGVVVWKSTNLFEFNVNSVLGRLGKAIEVKNEQYIDMATAISGSGPAYVYLFEELLVSAAKSIGLPENLAQELVTETFAGAVAIQKESNPQKLREKVTSKDGTTFAAIKVFKENNLAQIFQLAVKKAYERSQKLND